MTQTLTLRETLPPKGDQLSDRQRTLDLLLAHYVEAQETLYSGQGADAAASSGVLGMPTVWTPTYRRLERLLRLLRQEGHSEPITGILNRTAYWHLAEFYFRLRWHWQTPPPRWVQRGKRRVIAKDPRRLVIIRHDDIDTRRVRESIEWLDDAWTTVPPLRGRDKWGFVREEQGEPEPPRFGTERGDTRKDPRKVAAA